MEKIKIYTWQKFSDNGKQWYAIGEIPYTNIIASDAEKIILEVLNLAALGNDTYRQELYFKDYGLDWAFNRKALTEHNTTNVVRCRFCSKRYGDDCPLFKEITKQDGKGITLTYYDYGRSVDDDFYCADGEI